MYNLTNIKEYRFPIRTFVNYYLPNWLFNCRHLSKRLIYVQQVGSRLSLNFPIMTRHIRNWRFSLRVIAENEIISPRFCIFNKCTYIKINNFAYKLITNYGLSRLNIFSLDVFLIKTLLNFALWNYTRMKILEKYHLSPHR